MRRISESLSVFYDKRNAVCFGITAFALMVFILFGGRTIGLSDNGDFRRVMDASSLQFDTDDGAFSFDRTYKIVIKEQSGAGNVLTILFGADGFSSYPSLQIPIVRISVVLNLILNKLTGGAMQLYRIEVLGIMHCVLYTGAIIFLLKQFRLRNRVFDILAKSIILIVLCDVGYLTYFNSFYGEALQLISFIFLAAMLVRIITVTPRLPDAVLCAVGCIVLGWSKFFNIPAACAATVLLFGIILIKTKQKAPAAVGVVTLCILAVVYFNIPPWMSLQTKFNAVFFGALKDADAASCERYLSELGLPLELARYKNTNIYVEGVEPELLSNGYDSDIREVSNVDIAVLYLRHPDRLLHAVSVSLLNTDSIRPFYLSNYDNTAPKLTFSNRFSLWSDLRLSAGFDSWIGFTGILLIFALTVFFILKRSGRKWYEMMFVLCLSAAILTFFFIAPFMSNGEGDLAKHLFAYTQLTDLIVLFITAALLYALSERKAQRILPGCLFMILCLAFTPVKTDFSHILSKNKPHPGLDPGAYVSYGAFEGRDLLWQVTETGADVTTLLCVRAVAGAPFSTEGSNVWETSDVRQWLNTTFLSGFSEEERAPLPLVNNTVLLSRETKSTAVSGIRDFYFSPVPSLAARGYVDAYQTITKDTVMLPDISLVADMTVSGTNIVLSEAYWLDTPYFNNGYMVRCVMPDGSILMREAAGQAGIRPVISIVTTAPLSGSGTYKDPFLLA